MLYERFDSKISRFKIFTVTLRADLYSVITPPGNNLYWVRIIHSKRRMSDQYQMSLFTEQDNFAAQRVTAREVDGDVASSKACLQISNWLYECTCHDCCPQQASSTLPARVIEVATPKILHTHGAVGKFAALSYCWGTGSQVQLRSDTIEALSQHLEFNKLPQTIKDAVSLTRSLKIPYLWVR